MGPVCIFSQFLPQPLWTIVLQWSFKWMEQNVSKHTTNKISNLENLHCDCEKQRQPTSLIWVFLSDSLWSTMSSALNTQPFNSCATNTHHLKSPLRVGHCFQKPLCKHWTAFHLQMPMTTLFKLRWWGCQFWNLPLMHLAYAPNNIKLSKRKECLQKIMFFVIRYLSLRL